ncbi:MAG: stage II sporulation protein R [Ruminococcaceae bacterium]|nr:stage II sporulation protein R [Oscillospiraceae bacterium]
MLNTRKHIELSILFGLIFAILLSFARFDAACSQVRENVVRLHIIANSDSQADQALKLRVRDAILSHSGNLFENTENYDEALVICQNNLAVFEEIANTVIAENRFLYTAKATVGDTYFETREYDTFTLPAGTYKSLNIKLGKAEGKNWWCVVFPAVCISSATDRDLSASVGKDGVEITSNPKKYVMKFKAVEIYEDIKHFFK